jgi:hypothetical protein
MKTLVPDSHSLLLYTEQEGCVEKEDEKQILQPECWWQQMRCLRPGYLCVRPEGMKKVFAVMSPS